MDELQIGIAKVDVTPSGAVPMAGYVARVGHSLGVHDPLWARCFLFHHGRARGALVVLEVVGVHEHWAAEAQRRVAAAADVPPEKVVVACTHTHSGPAGLNVPPTPNPTQTAMAEAILARVEQAAAQAAQALAPARVGVATAPVPGIAGHRTRPQQPVDQTLWALVIGDAMDRVRAVLANFPCHSTVLGPDNRLLSGDLFGAAAAAAERRLGHGAVVALAVGAAGDISTRFFRQAQDFREVDRLGDLLATALVRLVQAATPARDASVAVRWRQCWLPYKPTPTVHEARRMAEELRAELAALVPQGTVPPGALHIARTRVEGAERLLAMVEAGVLAADGAEAVLYGLRIGPGILIGIPGEPFSSVGQAIRDRATPPFQATGLGLVNGYLGYFPDEDAVRTGWYEALISPFDHRATMVLTAAATALVAEMEEEDSGRRA